MLFAKIMRYACTDECESFEDYMEKERRKMKLGKYKYRIYTWPIYLGIKLNLSKPSKYH